jgi:hypothetical protein
MSVVAALVDLIYSSSVAILILAYIFSFLYIDDDFYSFLKSPPSWIKDLGLAMILPITMPLAALEEIYKRIQMMRLQEYLNWLQRWFMWFKERGSVSGPKEADKQVRKSPVKSISRLNFEQSAAPSRTPFKRLTKKQFTK